MKVIDAGTLPAVSIEPTDRADECHVTGVGSVPHRTFEHRVTRHRLDRQGVIDPGWHTKLLVLLLAVVGRLSAAVLAEGLGVDDGRELDPRALGVARQHSVELEHEEVEGLAEDRVVVRYVVAAVAHAPVLGDACRRAGARFWDRAEHADAARRWCW